MMFSVLLSVISSLIAYLELSMALVHMNIVRQRIRNNFVKEVVVAEEWRENFRMSRRNLLKLSELLRPHIA